MTNAKYLQQHLEPSGLPWSLLRHSPELIGPESSQPHNFQQSFLMTDLVSQVTHNQQTQRANNSHSPRGTSISYCPAQLKNS